MVAGEGSGERVVEVAWVGVNGRYVEVWYVLCRG